MKIEVAKFLKEASENAGNECEIREDYSGRGMFGRITVGVVVDSQGQLLVDVIQYVKEQIGELTYQQDINGGETTVLTWEGGEIPDPDYFRVDNMGQRVIVY